MIANEKDFSDVEHLVILLEKVVDYFKKENCSESYFRYIKKSLNILKNKDIKAMCKIKNNVLSDFRMMYDRGQYGGDINIVMDEIYKIVNNNPLFFCKN